MNKKINEQFKGIKDIYMLQCICTEQDDEIEKLQDRIDEAIEVLNDTNVDMDSILLCETIDYAIHILKGKG